MDKEFANSGYLTGAFVVCLVAMDHEDGIVQDDAFVNLDSREKGLINCLIVFPVQVMISPNLEVTGLFRIGGMEFSQEFIDGRMSNVDLVKIVILP